MIRNIIDSNDICFLIEHWLGKDEAYLINQLCFNHSIIFTADFENDNIMDVHLEVLFGSYIID